MIGTFSCVEGREQEMDAAIAAQVAAADGAAGVEVYSYHRMGDGSYAFFAQFASQAAFEALGKTEAMQAAMGPFEALLAARPDVSMGEPVASVVGS